MTTTIITSRLAADMANRKAQYDQIVGIKNFQPAVATLAAQSVKPTGSLQPQAVQLQEMQSMDRPIHTFRYEGLMKHLTDIKR